MSMDIIPNLFSKQTIPKNIPKELELKIREFSKGKNKEKFLEKAFAYIVRRWHGARINLLLKCHRLFYRDINKIFYLEGYLHCTNMTYILRIMMIKSGLFKEEDIDLKLTNNYIIFIHEYLQVKISKNNYINLDPLGYQFRIDYGEYSSWFKLRQIMPDIKRLNSPITVSNKIR